MEDKLNAPVYKQSFRTAQENQELKLYYQSNELNQECASAIDKAISDSNYDTFYYDLKSAAKTVLNEFGADRVAWVLAGVLQRNAFDGRYSSANKNWADDQEIPPEYSCVHLTSHPTVVDGFIDRVRQEVESPTQDISSRPSISSQLQDNKQNSQKNDQPEKGHSKHSNDPAL